MSDTLMILIPDCCHHHCFFSQGEVSYHQKRLRGDEFFDFGRIPQWNCPIAGNSHPRCDTNQHFVDPLGCCH